MKRDYRRVHITLPLEWLEKVDILAKEKHYTRSSLIRHIVLIYLNRIKREKEEGNQYNLGCAKSESE